MPKSIKNFFIKIWYCNEKCMISDIKMHRKKCEYTKIDIAEQKLEESKDSFFGLAGIKQL